jgi:hypothetical protein
MMLFSREMFGHGVSCLERILGCMVLIGVLGERGQRRAFGGVIC